MMLFLYEISASSWHNLHTEIADDIEIISVVTFTSLFVKRKCLSMGEKKPL